MKQSISLPSRFTWIGLATFIPFAILGFFNLYQEFELAWLATASNAKGLFVGNRNLTDEVALSGCITGLLLMCFARTKNEDEFIMSLRLHAWQWAVAVNFVLLLVAIWTVYDMHFFYFMVYNMLTILIIFLLRFQFLLFRNRTVNN